MDCRLCGGRDFETLPFYYAWDGRRFDGVRCRSCRLVTLSPLPSEEDLRRLYGEDYFAEGLHGLDRLRLSYEQWADGQAASAHAFLRRALLPRRPGARRLFEIGAAMGHFLAAAREEGLEVAGLEISATAVRRAREKFGLELECAGAERLEVAPHRGRWDIVYAGDLFEHLREPDVIVDKVHAMLAPGGLFALNVPGTFNLVSTRLAIPVLRACGRRRRLPDKPYHLYEYTTGTLHAMLARRFGRVEVVSTAVPPGRLNLKDRSAGYLAKYALQFVNWPLTALTGRFGDRMTAYAWKT